MGKIVDITEKLEFGANPRIAVKGKEYEVNADAETVLKIMGILSDEGTTAAAVVKMYELIFSEKERAAIAKLKLQFRDFRTLVETALNLVTGADEEKDRGEE